MADAPTRGGQAGTYISSPYNITVTYGAPGAGIIRGTGADWFGPLNPIAPVAPPDVAGRRFDFVPGYNLVTRPRAYEPIGFGELRGFADAYDMLRLVIETRKDQMERQSWAIRPIDPKYRRKSAKVDSDMQARIDAISDFWRKPDRTTPWKTWVRSLLEDMFVIDAATLYCQRTRGGKLFALPQLDGATIKPVIDDWGRTPVPYKGQDGAMVFPPAYQQVLKGFPAVDYSTRDIIYRPRNVRPHKVYGYSPVQQILLTVQIALRRQMWQLDYFTEGSIPDAFLGVPDSWTPDQIKQYQEYMDTLLSGDMAQRRRLRIVPGVKAQVTQTKEPEHKDDFDEWLARIICFAFSIPPTWAVKMMNRASGEKQSDQSEEEGLEPTKEWVKDLVDGIIVDEFNSPDLEIAWVEETDIDPAKNETVLEGRLKVGGITLNEFRDNLGLDPYTDDAANKPMVLTPNGYVPIDAQTIEGKQANIEAFGLPPAPGASGNDGEENAGGKDDNADKSGDALNGKYRFGKARGRRLAPVPFDRPAAQRAVRAVRELLSEVFSKLQPKIIASVRDGLAKAKTPKAHAKAVTDDLDMSAVIDLADDIGDDLADLAEDSVQEALAQLGVDDRSDLVDQINEVAVKAAREQAADLVSGIDERTRDMLRDLIAGGLEDNLGTDAITDSIADSGLFSDDRADLIARTEVSRANSEAALEGYRGARDSAGVSVRKEWLLGPNPCEICQDNADDGDIDIDDDFSSGDDAPPAHPNCECAVSPVVDDDADKIAKGYDPDQPRDEHGRWSGGNGGWTEDQIKAEIGRGRAAMQAAIDHGVDTVGAMGRPGLEGKISFYAGDQRGGVTHIVEQHGRDVAMRLPTVIARGKLGTQYTTASGRARVNINYQGYRAVISPDRHGAEENWLVTGFRKK